MPGRGEYPVLQVASIEERPCLQGFVMTVVYGNVDWYRSRPEPEETWTGTLAEREVSVGPESRGGLFFVLITDMGPLSVYAANVERQLASFLGRSVRVRGKLVDLGPPGQEKELWPASMELEDIGLDPS